MDQVTKVRKHLKREQFISQTITKAPHKLWQTLMKFDYP